ncbi:MAG: hypothetical protein RL154_1107, partial [Pseudomonadota bacterium]
MRNKILKTVAALFIFLLSLYAAVGFFVLPYFIEVYLPKKLNNQYDINITIGKVEFNPYTFKAKLQDFNLSQNNEDIVLFQNLKLKIEPFEIFKNSVSISNLSIDNLILNFQIDKNDSFNIKQLLQKFESKDNNNSKSSRFLYNIANLDINNSTINFKDLSSKISNLDINAIDISNIGQTSKIQIFSNIDGAKVNAIASLNIASRDANISCAFDNIEIKKYYSYLLKNDFKVSANADGYFNIQYIDSNKRIDIKSFDSNLTNVHIIDDNLTLNIKKLAFEADGIKIDKRLSVNVKQIDFDAVFVKNSMQDLISFKNINSKKIEYNGLGVLVSSVDIDKP